MFYHGGGTAGRCFLLGLIMKTITTVVWLLGVLVDAEDV
jgi:hypothetical protein